MPTVYGIGPIVTNWAYLSMRNRSHFLQYLGRQRLAYFCLSRVAPCGNTPPFARGFHDHDPYLLIPVFRPFSRFGHRHRLHHGYRIFRYALLDAAWLMQNTPHPPLRKTVEVHFHFRVARPLQRFYFLYAEHRFYLSFRSSGWRTRNLIVRA